MDQGHVLLSMDRHMILNVNPLTIRIALYVVNDSSLLKKFCVISVPNVSMKIMMNRLYSILTTEGVNNMSVQQYVIDKLNQGESTMELVDKLQEIVVQLAIEIDSLKGEMPRDARND